VAAFDIAASAALMDDLTAIGARVALAVREQAGTGVVRSKADGSPVTAADDSAEALIRDALAALAPAVPIVSEEHAAWQKPEIPTGEGASYFVVDPLDGTREFIAGRDEYTINIALVAGAAPVLGLIIAPALGVAWRGIIDRRADRVAIADGKMSPPTTIRARPRPPQPVIMVSRSHLDPRTRAYVNGFPQAELVRSGSAIKFGRVAEGSADLYPRLAPTRDWDVAAGHALIRAAGGTVTAPDGSPILYGTAQLVIPGFIASGVSA